MTAPLTPTVALMLREMATTYGRSPGGYLWAFLEPVAAIALLSLAFSLAFRAPSLGGSFPLFYATGYLPFFAFHDTTNKIAAAITFSRPLMSYPAVRPIDAILARAALNLLTHLTVFAVVTTAILALLPARAHPDPAPIALALAMGAGLAIGAGTLNCCLATAFPAWERLWSIATRPLFLISGVFFLLEAIPLPYRDWLWWNPLLHVSGIMRRGFYPEYAAAYASPAYVFAIALMALALGLVMLRRIGDSLIR